MLLIRRETLWRVMERQIKSMQGERLECIEGMRGFAAIIVFMHHFAVMFYPAFYWGGEEKSHCNGIEIWIGQTPFAFLLNGNSGVMLFLMLVGFGTYMVCRRGVNAYRRYLVLRYFKLVFLAIIASAFVWILLRANLTFYQDVIGEIYTPWFDNWNPKELNYFSILKENPLISLQKYNNTLWTMQYIFMGSILCVVLYIICENCRGRYWIYLLSIIVLINMLQVYMIPCVVGFVLADLYSHNVGYKLKIGTRILLTVLGVYFCAYPTGVAPTLAVYSILPFKYCLYYHIIGVGCLIYVVLFGTFLSKFLKSRILQLCGKYSMSVYMVHYGVLISYSAWLYSILSDYVDYNCVALYNLITTTCVVALTAASVQKASDFIYDKMNRLYSMLFENT